MNNFRKKINKVSKGYRLKPETHQIINKIQEVINGDQDEAISNACRMYYNEISLQITEMHLMPNQELRKSNS